ncbi:MAG: glycosyltransferase family 4 protein [Deltaproteobacteria bacterium]|nr:glycosyltransferase family 4 protein [Deltaproteobacteria bacterium]
MPTDLPPIPAPAPAARPRRPARIGMLSYSFYEVDARVTRYAETLVRRGDTVDVLALGQPEAAGQTTVKGVNVLAIQRRERNERGKLAYLYRLLKFFVNSSVQLNQRHRQQPYDLIHVHSVPDFEVFAAWFPKLKGAKIILDIHDIVPEFYAAKFKVSPESVLCRLLRVVEKLSISFSDWVIISNHLWEKKLRRSVPHGNCSVVLNYPDETIFFRRPRKRKDGKFVLLYPGTLNWHQGLDLALSALGRIKDEAPGVELHLYGRGGTREALEAQARRLGVSDRVIFRDPIPKEKIAEAMAEADLGVVPKRNDPFGGEAFSTKILEFMAVGVPVLVAGTKIDRFYFNDSVVKFFEPDNPDDLAGALRGLIQNPEERRALVDRAALFLKDYSWEGKKHLYLDLVDKLIEP